MGMPAKPDAMPVANGLTVEASTPTPEPSRMIPAATMRSKPAAIITGTISAQKATVSSAMPKVEPPRANRAISTGISNCSARQSRAIDGPTPASSAALHGHRQKAADDEHEQRHVGCPGKPWIGALEHIE